MALKKILVHITTHTITKAKKKIISYPIEKKNIVPKTILYNIQNNLAYKIAAKQQEG